MLKLLGGSCPVSFASRVRLVAWQRILAMAIAVIGAETAMAETYYFSETATDFSVAGNYAVGSATGTASTVVPGPGDIVVLPRRTKTYPLTAGTDSFNAFAQIGEFRVDSWGFPTFSLIVPSGKVTINTAFNSLSGSRSPDTARWFTVEKSGQGELVLAGFDRYPTSHPENEHWNYQARFKVREGSLSFDTSEMTGIKIYIGVLDVSAGATVRVPCLEDSDLQFVIRGLAGAGLITNECTVAGRKTLLDMNMGTYMQPFKFSGAIGGPIAPTFTSENDLRGSRSTFEADGTVSANDAGWSDAAGMMNEQNLRRITVVDMLGLVGEASPLGLSSVAFSQFGGELYYDGPGETTDRSVKFAHTSQDNKFPACFNAGAVGGLGDRGQPRRHELGADHQRLLEDLAD